MRAELGGGDGSCDGIGDLSFGLDGGINIDLGGGGGGFSLGGPTSVVAPPPAIVPSPADVAPAPLPRLGTTRERLAAGAFRGITQSDIPFMQAAVPQQVPTSGKRSFLVAPAEPMSTGKKVAIAAGGVGALGTVTLLAWLAMR